MFTTGGGRPPAGGRQACSQKKIWETTTKKKMKNAAGLRPAGGRPRFLARRYTSLGSPWGPKNERKCQETSYMCRFWSRFRLILGRHEAPQDSRLRPSACPLAGRRPAGFLFYFFVIRNAPSFFIYFEFVIRNRPTQKFGAKRREIFCDYRPIWLENCVCVCVCVFRREAPGKFWGGSFNLRVCRQF